MIYAGILAGGVGSRMGVTEMPKQFLPVAGKPVILYTIESFLQCSRIDHIYVAVVSDYVSHMKGLLNSEFGVCDRITVVEGGSDRNGSIVNVISTIRRTDSDPDSVLITHDAVRPFVSPRIIDENIDAAIEFGATDTVVPATDTIIRSADDEYIDDIPVRSELYHGQTPQTFRIGWFEQDYFALSEEQKKTLTDACRIFTLSGRRVRLVMGDAFNLKITTPFDLRLAEAIVAERSDKK
ncbi:MAG: 2-C-methyl-D-erythritol 4-phosphate cytidylyltransferase [Ruminococcaceae bacterium]|nr:2-C-methyl-D-erythritol 4-phosphate cytidylyltransferase [Oscillospiraceae bacterium]